MSVALLRNDLKKAHASGKKSKEQALSALAQAGSSKYQKKSDVTKPSIQNTQAGTLHNVQLLPDSNQLNVKTNYAFYFTTSSELPRNSYVEISFPVDYFSNLSEV